MLIQEILDENCFYLKKVKYKNILQELKLEYSIIDDIPYIRLILIKIKKSQQCKGYGSSVLFDLIKLANEYHVNIILIATYLYGADIKRLYAFYRKHGFILINNNKEGKFIYKYKKILSKQL